MMDDAFEHLQKSEWTEARRAFESELTAHPKNLEARYNLALLMAKAGHREREKELYIENMQKGWHLPSVVNLAAIYTAAGDIKAARNLLKKAVKKFRYEATPRYLLAELDEKSGNTAGAADWYEEALKTDPLNGFAHIRYARFLSAQKRHEEALKHAERAVALLPDSASALAILGDVQVAAGEDDEALASYQKSLAARPDPRTRQRLIDLLHRNGEHERANRMQEALDAWLKLQKS